MNFRSEKASGSQNVSRAGSPTFNTPPARHRKEGMVFRDALTTVFHPIDGSNHPGKPLRSVSTSDFTFSTDSPKRKKNSKEMDPNLGPAPLFANSTVDLIGVCLNEELLKENNENGVIKNEIENLSRSTPDIQKNLDESHETTNINQTGNMSLTKRAESEPSLPFLVENEEPDSDS